MKMSKISNQIWLGAIVAIVLLVSFPALAYDAKTIDKAEKSYEEGVTAYSKKYWWKAEQHFRESYDHIPHPMTAYALSCSYIKLEEPKNALEFAKKAMSGTPPLNKAYTDAARKIISWAEKAEGDSYYLLKGKADDLRPQSPKNAPPKALIPPNNLFVY